MNNQSKTAAELAALLGGVVQGDVSVVIDGVGSLDGAGAAQVLYASGRKNFVQAVESGAGAVITKTAYVPTDHTLILVDDPKAAYVRCLELFQRKEKPGEGISRLAEIDPSVQLGADVTVLPFTVMLADSVIGDGCTIYSNVFIGRRVRMGRNCTVHPGVVIGDDTDIGDDVIIYGNVVIGADGFGYERQEDGQYTKIPQIGRVSIGDRVEIGANSTIDRATAGLTRLENGVKIDNLVQIAHNVVVGENTVIAGQSGVAGSTTIGRNCILAGQVGVADHCTIGDNVLIGAKSGVQSKTLKGDTAYFGYPAREMNEMRRIMAAQVQLPEKLRDLQRQNNTQD